MSDIALLQSITLCVSIAAASGGVANLLERRGKSALVPSIVAIVTVLAAFVLALVLVLR